jgi:predicted transglutaminase-like cysteine proteinase
MRYIILLLILLAVPAIAANDYLIISGMHRHALSQHTYISDVEQYGVAEKWEASLNGDCEDYALYMQNSLIERGYQSEIWIVRTELDELHAVVVITIFNFEFVIDNRHASLKPRSMLAYKWIAPVEFYNKNIRQRNG